MMSFFKKVQSSVYDPHFYSKLKAQGLGTTLKYFFLLIALLTVVNTALLSYELLVRVPESVRNFVAESVKSYPADLEVDINDGQVTTNTQEPFFVPFPEATDEYNGINNLLVIDTKTPYSSSQFDQYKTMAWLTRDTLFFQNREYDQRSIALNEVEDFKVDKGFVENIATQVNPWLNLVGPFLLIVVFIGMFIGFIFNLTYLLFLAVFIYFLSAIFKWGLSYSTAYKTAIYASTLSFIVDLVLFNTGFYTGFFGFPFLFTLIALCVTTINLQNFQEKS